MSQKIITVTLTSSVYEDLGSYLMDYRSPAYPGSLRGNKEKKAVDQFDWQAYAKTFCRWQSEYSDKTEYQNTINKDDRGNTNLNAILNAFKNYPADVEEIRRLANGGNYLDLPLKPGIKFSIPLESINREALLVHGVEVVSNNEPAFKAQALINIENDLGYKKVFKQNSDNIDSGDISIQFPDMTVWIWCRSLSSNINSEGSELKGQIFNITPFITQLTSSNTKDGGNFTFNVSPILGEKDNISGKWILKDGSFLLNSETGEVLTQTHLHDYNGGSIERSQLLFHNMIGTNDLVFIRYETLDMEVDQRIRDVSDFIINKSDIAGRLYDMIGLVDRNLVSNNFETQMTEITITGRDLSKLFIEDGTYFYSLENKEGVMYVNGAASANSSLMNRVVSTNAYMYLGLYYNNTIEEIIKFVIQQLSGIKVVPDDLFESYAGGQTSTYNRKLNNVPADIRENIDRRNKRFNDKLFDLDVTEGQSKVDREKSKSALQESRRLIIEKIKNYRAKEFAESNVSESLLTSTTDKIFDELVEWMEYVLNNKTSAGSDIIKLNTHNNIIDGMSTTIGVEKSNFAGWRAHVYKGEDISEDVFPSVFYTNNSSSPKLFYPFVDIDNVPFSFDTDSICNDIYNYVTSKNQLYKHNPFDEPEVLGRGIWQIVKLVIDKKVAKRMLIDPSMSSASGSLINFLKKVASEPFVELFMDTYGDEFYIIVRQPPFDKIGMHSFMTGNYQSNQNINEWEDNITRPAVVDVEEIDVASEDLYYDDSQVYSWYHFTPQGAFLGGKTNYSTSFIPAIFFPEYAEIWGTKSLDLIHNYTNYYQRYRGEQKDISFSDVQLQLFNDMKYVVESNQYLPFTRKGTIVLKGGDRRIKVGNPIRLKSTGEIFWVDSVSNAYSINEGNIERSTTVRVSRGLNEAFIYGVKGSMLNKMFENKGFRFSEDKIFSYFNIIDTELELSKTRIIDIYEERELPETYVEIEGFINGVPIGYETQQPKAPQTPYYIHDDARDTHEDWRYRSYLLNKLDPVLSPYFDPSTLPGQGIPDINNISGLVPYNVGTDRPWELFDPTKLFTYDNLNKPLNSQRDELLLQTCDEETQPIFRRFLNKLEQIGWSVYITSARRSYEEQKAINLENSKAAAAGRSMHNFGRAIDLNLTAKRDLGDFRKGFRLTLAIGDNKVEANRRRRRPDWLKAGIPQIAESFGIFWGGHYSNYADNVHFEIPLSKDRMVELEKMRDHNDFDTYQKRTERVKVGEQEVVDEMAVFSNFKVDKEIFNFFLRRQEVGIKYNQSFRIEDRKGIDSFRNMVNSGSVNEENLSALSKATKDRILESFSKFKRK